MNRITIQAVVDNYTGYGELFCETFFSLRRLGYFPNVRPIKIDTSFNTVIPFPIQEQIVWSIQPEPVEMLIAPPHHLPTPGKKVIYYTMWESSRLSDRSVDLLNRSVAVIVPTYWGKTAFRSSGVRVPIYEVPLGFKPDIFKHSPLPDGPCVFGVAGRMAHGGPRKGMNEAIEAFQDAFHGVTDVRLHVKCHADCAVPRLRDPRIFITRDHLKWEDVARWMRRITVFISAAKGEGFGLWQLQALASGRPVIGCLFSGVTEFMTSENSYPVDFKLVNANPPYEGKWAEPNGSSLVEQMRRVYIDRKELNTKCKANNVQQFAWPTITKILGRVLKKIGV